MSSAGIVHQATSCAAGGYQMELPAGSYSLSFSGSGAPDALYEHPLGQSRAVAGLHGHASNIGSDTGSDIGRAGMGMDGVRIEAPGHHADLPHHMGMAA